MTPGSWPKLYKLDSLFLLLPEDHPDTFGKGSVSLGESVYEKLKSKLGFPYDAETARAHVGFVQPYSMEELFWSRLIEKYALSLRMDRDFNVQEKVLKEKLYQRADFRKNVWLVGFIRTATHEVAHQLGAAHVGENPFKPAKDSKYFESYTGVHMEAAFHPENIQAMKEFIRTVKSAFSTSVFTGGISAKVHDVEKAGSKETAPSEASMPPVY